MTNFFAMYLFLILAVIMLVLGLIFKHSWLFWLSAIGWMATGFYCFTINDAEYVAVFGLFCFLLTLAMVIIPVVIGRKAIPTPLEEDNYTRMSRRIEAMRGRTDGFKPKGKEPFL